MRRDEKARRSWLLHHLETSNWAEAELLVVSAAEQEQLTQARETKEREAAQQAQQTQAQQVQEAQQAQALENEAWQAAADAEASEDAPASPRLRAGRIRPHRQATIPDSLREQVDTPNTCRGMVKAPWPSQQPTRPPTALEAHPLARGCPLGPRGAPSPRGCRKEATATLWAPTQDDRSHRPLATQVPARASVPD